MTKAEVVLWQALRRQQFRALKFCRQHPVGPYILDFYCDTARLCVEIDGASHEFEARAEQDARRDAWLMRQKITILRIPARAVHDDLEAVLNAIAAAAPSASHALGASPKGGG